MMRRSVLALIGLVAGAVAALGGIQSAAAATETAIFAGGCFWCMEPPFDAINGVLSTTSGYTGGTKVNPTYKQVSSGTTGHAESEKIVFDPSKVSYQQLLYVFWRNHDPLTADGQFCDHGNQYRPAVFYTTPRQKQLAEASKAALEQSGRFDRPIVTQIVPAGPFYPAEAVHQNFYRTHPVRYKFYRSNCGRDSRLRHLWGSEAGAGH
jgi:peptide-methionine (S)-S-oxide reductase